ncbi:hypothetical protein VCHENC02_5880B, partial [Vibrio harveyi]
WHFMEGYPSIASSVSRVWLTMLFC